jgi:hypothetical protein
VNLPRSRCAKLATMANRTGLRAAVARRPDGGRRFGLLLALLVSTYLVSAFVSGSVIKTLQLALFLVVVLTAVRASRVPRRIARMVNAVVVAGTAAALVPIRVSPDTPSGPETGTAFAWIALMLLFAAFLIISEVLTAKDITLQSIFGAISAYLIIGSTFAAVYGAISAFGGGHFFANGQPGTVATFQYFSFVTLTTVGYGDFTAAAASGRAVAVLEAILGQVFLAVLVGWLVSVYRAPRFSRDDTESTPPASVTARQNRAAMNAAIRRSARPRPRPSRPGAGRVHHPPRVRHSTAIPPGDARAGR